MEAKAKPFTILASKEWQHYQEMIHRTDHPALIDIDFLKLVKLIPDMIEDQHVTIDQKLQLLRQHHCYFQPGEFLTMTPFNGTLHIIAENALEPTERIVTVDQCQLNITPPAVAEAVYRLDLPRDWYEGPRKNWFRNETTDKVPDFVGSNPVSLTHKRGLLNCKPQQLADDMWVKLDPMTKTLWWSQDNASNGHWWVVHKHQVDIGRRLKIEELPIGETAQPIPIQEQYAYQHLSMKQQGMGDRFSWLYDIEEILKYLPDAVNGHGMVPSQKAMLLITGVVDLAKDVQLKLDAIQHRFLLIQPEGGQFKYDLATIVTCDQCEFNTQPIEDIEKLFRYPVTDEEFKLAYRTWNPQLPGGGIEPKMLQRIVDKFPDMISGSNLSDGNKIDILFSRKPIDLLKQEFSFDYHSGLILSHVTHFDGDHLKENKRIKVLPVREACCFNRFSKKRSQQLKQEKKVAAKRDQGIDI